MKKLFLLLTIPFMVLSFSACEEEDGSTSFGTPTGEDMQPIEDNMNSEKGLMTSANYMNPYGLDEELSSKKSVTEDNPDYDFDTAEYILTVDFTDVAGMGGEIVVNYDSNPLDTPITSIGATTSLNDFAIGSTTYNATLMFEMEVTDEAITMSIYTDGDTLQIDNGGDVSTWYGNRDVIWLEGYTTPVETADDLFQIEGSASGMTSNGTNYESEITSPLVFSLECDYIMSGQQEILDKVGTEEQTTLKMTYNVDSEGNLLDEPECNPYFKLVFNSPNMEVELVMNFGNI